MKQATLVEIAESCKVTRGAAQHWAMKAGEKISSIKRKLAEARPYHPAIFNEDEIVCIVGAHLEIMGDFTEATLQDPIEKTLQDPIDVESVVTKETNSLLQKRQSSRDSLQNETNGNPNIGLPLSESRVTKPSLENKIEIMKLVMDAARLFKETTPGASADYCLNWAKKRLSGRNNGNSYTPIMNLLEAPNNEEE